jgi:integrase
VSVKRLAEGHYEVQARDGAGKHRRRRFTTRREARDYDRKLADERKQAKHERRTPRAEKLTLARYCTEYLSTHNAKPQSLRALSERLAVVVRDLGELNLRDLDRTNIGQSVRGLDHYAPTTQRGILKALRQVLNQAVRDDLIRANPARDVQLTGLSRPPISPFRSWDEVDRLATNAGRYGGMIRFAAHTGLRWQELLALQPRDLDLDHQRLTINRAVQDGRIVEGSTKTSRSHRTIPLSNAALDALSEQGIPEDSHALIFGHRDGTLLNLHNFRSRVWYGALDATGLKKRGPSQLRHTFATLALAQGIPITDVSRMLGHSDIATTTRYYAGYLPEMDDRLLRLLNAAA